MGCQARSGPFFVHMGFVESCPDDAFSVSARLLRAPQFFFKLLNVDPATMLGYGSDCLRKMRLLCILKVKSCYDDAAVIWFAHSVGSRCFLEWGDLVIRS